MDKFKIGDTVEYFDGDKWVEEKILDVDIADPDKPYKISSQGCWTKWVKEDQIRRKQIEITLVAKSNKTCPLCGKDGLEGVVFFYCNNASCINYYDRNK